MSPLPSSKTLLLSTRLSRLTSLPLLVLIIVCTSFSSDYSRSNSSGTLDYSCEIKGLTDFDIRLLQELIIVDNNVPVLESEGS